MFKRKFVAIVPLLASIAVALEPPEKVMFDFSETGAAIHWQTVNDGVMGGRSDGRFSIDNNNTLAFFGTLSLENNGGFASVRSREKQLNLREGDTLVTRLKGDGRRYTLNLYISARQRAFSYRHEFQSEKDEWIEVRVPLQDFVATSFGRIVTTAGPIDPQQVNAIGFLLGDKQEGPFKLEVDWIKAEPACESRKEGTLRLC